MMAQAARSTSRFERWRGAMTMAVIACLPLAAAVLYIKHRLSRDATWVLQPQVPKGALQTASLFVADAFQALAVTPVVLLVLFGWLPGRPRAIAMGVSTVLLTALVVAGWLTFLGVGGWPTPGLVAEFVSAVRTDAGLVDPSAYIPAGAMRDGALLAGFALVPLLLVVDRIRHFVIDATLPGRAAVAVLLIALVAGIGLRAYGDQRGPGRGTLSRVLELALSPQANAAPGSGAAHGIATDWSSISFSSRADAERPGPPTPPNDRACRSAILLILETAADRDYSWDTLVEAMPRNRWYLERAIVARRHFASHVRSNRADFTLLSGIYDLTDDRPLQTYLRRAGATSESAPGIAATLRGRGYDTRYYFPRSRFTYEDDEWAVSYLGFEHVFTATDGFPGVLSLDLRMANELQIFEQAVDDLRNMDRGQPFLLVFRTMLGHDPTFSPRTKEPLHPGDSTNRTATTRDVLSVVDSLLHNVVVAASQREDSSRIAIAIVGDHGRRNYRDPDLARGSFPLVSYRVPSVISCPSLFDRPVFATDATSHVDVAPTLAWTLGIDTLAGFPAGLVMIDPRLKGRFTFTFAAKTGVDAVLHGDTIAAVNLANEPPYRVLLGRSPTVTTVIDRGSAASKAAEARFAAVRRTQYGLIEQLAGKRSSPAASLKGGSK